LKVIKLFILKRLNTERKDDLKKIKQSEQLVSSGLFVKDTFKKNPKVILLGVPCNISEIEVLDTLSEQNIAEHVTADQKASIKLSHKSGKKDASHFNYVLQVSVDVRRVLIRQDRVYINWKFALFATTRW
jgi:hypothetical protein